MINHVTKNSLDPLGVTAVDIKPELRAFDGYLWLWDRNARTVALQSPHEVRDALSLPLDASYQTTLSNLVQAVRELPPPKGLFARLHAPKMLEDERIYSFAVFYLQGGLTREAGAPRQYDSG
jgi:hypothetical protein